MINARALASWVYIRSEPGLWTIGFYTPDGQWMPESDHPTADEAAARCAYLNGGGATTILVVALRTCEAELVTLKGRLTGSMYTNVQTCVEMIRNTLKEVQS